jgi:hypothetical protein
MKAILEFDLPEDDYEYRSAINGSSWRSVSLRMDEFLRQNIKYRQDLTEQERMVYESIRKELFEQLDRYNLDLDEA